MTDKRVDGLQDTLDLLILRTLTLGPMHGYAIVRRLQQITNDVLEVEEGVLYPILHRMAHRGWIEGEWGVSKDNQRAKFYRLTRAGHRQLPKTVSSWERLYEAMTKVLQLTPKGG